MAFNGSGTYNRTNGTYTGSTVWNQDATNGVKIESARHDTHDQDIATALSNCVCKDGQTTITANLPMSTYKHTNVAVATARTDYARYSQVQDSGSVHAADGGSANTYTLTLAPAITAYALGQRFHFFAQNTNTGASTLNVNGVGAVAIRKGDGSVALGAADIVGGDLVSVVYDTAGGGRFHMERNRFIQGSYSQKGFSGFADSPIVVTSKAVTTTSTTNVPVLTITMADNTSLHFWIKYFSRNHTDGISVETGTVVASLYRSGAGATSKYVLQTLDAGSLQNVEISTGTSSNDAVLQIKNTVATGTDTVYTVMEVTYCVVSTSA